MCLTDGSPYQDVWEDGNRAPVATEITKEEAAALVAEKPMARQACCSYCGLVGLDIEER